MPLPKVIIAAAGSGKTHDLVVTALADSKKRVIIVTYTEQNLAEIRNRIISACGCVPNSIDLLTWYSFLIRHCVRPYQYPLYPLARIEGAFFPKTTQQDELIRNRRYISRNRIADYYIFGKTQVVGDFASEFAFRCNESNGNAMIRRLEQVYDLILIDEVQDLAGYDLDLLELMFGSQIEIEVVGDCRQVTYKTNTITNKNRKYRDDKIIEFFQELEKSGKCEIVYRTVSRRCVQAICDFADRLYPDLPKTKSENVTHTEHDGVFFVSPDKVQPYFRLYAPQVLRWDRRTQTCSANAINFGESKGATFDRTLIYLTNPLCNYLRDFNALPNATRAKFYVAVTRARFSTALVYEGPVYKDFIIQNWNP